MKTTVNVGNSNSNFESLETLKTHQLSNNFAVSTKNINSNHLISMSQSSLRSPSKESFHNGSSLGTRNDNFLMIKDENLLARTSS